MDIKAIYDKYKDYSELSASDAEEVLPAIQEALRLYKEGKETGISDSEYDLLVDLYMFHGERDVPISAEADSNYKATHKYLSLRGTLDKIYYLSDSDVDSSDTAFNRTGLPEWINNAEKKIHKITGEKVDLSWEQVYVFPKFDGESIVLEVDKDENLIRALTRGDTEKNLCEDVTENIRKCYVKQNLNLGVPYGLKCECIMSDEDFAEYNKLYRPNNPYKQTRAATVAALHSKDNGEKAKYLTLIPLRYSILDGNGNESLQELPVTVFNAPVLISRLGDTSKIQSWADEHHSVFVNNKTYRCDGAVIFITDERYREILGREHERQKSEVAYKFTEERGWTTVKDITFQVGRRGIIIPVLKVKKLTLKGNTIKSISLHSANIFMEKGICKGDEVEVKYDIVPLCGEIKSMHKGEPFTVPKTCPKCGAELEWNSNVLICPNELCSSRVMGRILDYCERLGIKQVGPSFVYTLWNAGKLEDIRYLYLLERDKDAILECTGYSEKRFDSILDEINAHKTLDRATMLGAIGIQNCGIKTFRNIFKHIDWKSLKKAVENNEDISYIPGVGNSTMEYLYNGIKDNMKIIEFLEKMLTITEPRTSANLTITFTKCRPDINMKKVLEDDYNAVVDDSLTKQTDILVVPIDGITSSKIRKAKSYGIPIVNLNDLIPYLNKKISDKELTDK